MSETFKTADDVEYCLSLTCSSTGNEMKKPKYRSDSAWNYYRATIQVSKHA